MFDLASLVDRFRHVPTELHAEADKHAKVEEILRDTAAQLLDLIPQAQEADQIVVGLEAAGKLVHAAIDRHAALAQAGVIRANDKIVGVDSGDATSEVSGEATSQAGAAPEAATPPAPPAAPATQEAPVPPTPADAAASTAASPTAPTETAAAPDVPAVALPDPVADVAAAAPAEGKPAHPTA